MLKHNLQPQVITSDFLNAVSTAQPIIMVTEYDHLKLTYLRAPGYCWFYWWFILYLKVLLLTILITNNKTVIHLRLLKEAKTLTAWLASWKLTLSSGISHEAHKVTVSTSTSLPNEASFSTFTWNLFVYTDFLKKKIQLGKKQTFSLKYIPSKHSCVEHCWMRLWPPAKKIPHASHIQLSLHAYFSSQKRENQ